MMIIEPDIYSYPISQTSKSPNKYYKFEDVQETE